jgi:hypothetical protein
MVLNLKNVLFLIITLNLRYPLFFLENFPKKIRATPDFIFPLQEFGIQKSGVYVKKGNAWRFTDLNSFSSMIFTPNYKAFSYFEPELSPANT